jgi:hypothetical protein
MNIGLVPMSAKPYHLGHHLLVQFAALGVLSNEIKRTEGPENDLVLVFVSFSSRGTKKTSKGEIPLAGDTPVYGSDMRYIWKNLLIPNLNLPKNVKFLTPDEGIPSSPVLSVLNILNAVHQAKKNDEMTVRIPYADVEVDLGDLAINIYSDEEDIAANYPDADLERRYPGLLQSTINKIGLSRSATIDISGTKMRNYLCTGERDKFIKLLPPVSKDIAIEIYETLKTSVENSCPRSVWKPTAESLRRKLIRLMI